MSYRVLNICAVLLVVASLLMAVALYAAVSPAMAGDRCTEDQSCWVWSKMGNQKRGIVTMWGTPKVVTPCEFARLHRQHNLSPGSRAGSMRGDWYAIQTRPNCR